MMLAARSVPVRAAPAPRVCTLRPRVAPPRCAPLVRAVEAPVELAAAADEPEELEEARAILRFIRGSPHKYRRVLDVIRGRTYEEALKLLTYLPYRACEPILKVLLSAGANAKHNLGMRKSKLYISQCYCDAGPIMKRFRPRAQGRAYRIQKKTSHITIKVAERQD